MGKPFHYIILVFVLMGCFSCKRHVCPSYFSAFSIEKGSPEKFFNYFEADTAKSPVALKDTIPNSHRLLRFEKGEEPVDDRMFKSKGRNINGLVNQKKKLFSNAKKQNKNFMKVVRAEITISDIDSLEAAELYAVSDPLFNPDRFKRDQYIYMALYGFELMDSAAAQNERAQAKMDSTGDNGLPPKLKRALRRQHKREYRRLKKAAKNGEIEQSEADAYYEEYLAKPKKQKKQKGDKKGKKGKNEDDVQGQTPSDNSDKDKKKRGKDKKSLEDDKEKPDDP